MGMIGRKSWGNTDNLPGMAFTIVFDIQLLLRRTEMEKEPRITLAVTLSRRSR